MTPRERELRELGHHRAYSCANYAENVSGQPVPAVSTRMPSGLSEQERMYFEAGWDEGLDEYEQDGETA